jgi:hypothetical protein
VLIGWALVAGAAELGWAVLMAALGRANRITRLLESIALGTDIEVAAGSDSAAFTGADSIIAQAAASAVKVASFGDLIEALLERVVFIEVITLFNLFGCYLFIGQLIIRI